MRIEVTADEVAPVVAKLRGMIQAGAKEVARLEMVKRELTMISSIEGKLRPGDVEFAPEQWAVLDRMVKSMPYGHVRGLAGKMEKAAEGGAAS